jgi:hypothetical protein
VHSPKAPSPKHTTSDDTKFANIYDQDSEDENSPRDISTKQPPCTGHQTAGKPNSAQATHYDFSPQWMKDAPLTTAISKPKEISAQEPGPEDECLSKKTPTQITTSSKGQHNKGQSATSGTGTKKPKNRKANK